MHRGERPDEVVLMTAIDGLLSAVSDFRSDLESDAGLRNKHHLYRDEVNEILRLDRGSTPLVQLQRAVADLKPGVEVWVALDKNKDMETLVHRVFALHLNNLKIEFQAFQRWLDDCRQRTRQLRDVLGQQ